MTATIYLDLIFALHRFIAGLASIRTRTSPIYRSFLHSISAALALLSLTSVSMATSEIGDLQQACRDKFVVVFDVGHNKKAPGARSARGRSEYEFNLDLAKFVLEKLRDQGFQKIHILINEGSADLKSLLSRVNRAHTLNPDLFISIHHDSVQPKYLQPWNHNGVTRYYSDKASGFSVFVSRLNGASRQSVEFAKSLADGLLKRKLNFSLHHAEQIPGESRELADPERGIFWFDELVVLRANKVPAVLFEAGVIVNRDEELTLSRDTHRQSVADAFADAIVDLCVGRMTFSPAQQ